MSSSTSTFDKIFSTNSLIKLQVFSGVAFASFVFLHLLNVGLAHFGLASAEKVQALFRLYYQNPYVEPFVVMGSLIIHILANSILTVRRWAREKNPKAIKPLTTAQKLNRYSAYALGMLVPMHLTGLRLPSVMFGDQYKADLSLISFTLQRFGLFFVPAALIGIAGLYHMTFGLVQASDRLLRTKIARGFLESRWFLLVMGVGAGLVISSLVALKGVYFDVGNERHAFWASYYNGLFSIIGVDMGL